MGRRNTRKVLAQDGDRMSIGDAHVEAACRHLDATAKIEAALLISARWSAIRTAELLFSPDTLQRVRAAVGYVEPESNVMNYGDVLSYVTIQLNYASCPSLLPIEARKIDPQLPAFNALATTAMEVCDIHRKYGRVKAMLRWFNKNATPGAVRNYWPSVLQLCPDAAAFKDMIETPPDRYATPSDIGAMLPLIRDTAGTVAGMALMSKDASPNSDLGVRLICKERTDSWEGLNVSLNEVHFNL